MDRQRAIVRLGVLCLLSALPFGAWALWARQAPGSTYYLGMLAEPIEALRDLALWSGGLLLLSAVLGRDVFPRGTPRVLVASVAVGVPLALGTQLYAACEGMLLVQLDDPRPDARPLFALKHLGLALLLAFPLETARRLLLGPRGD